MINSFLTLQSARIRGENGPAAFFFAGKTFAQKSHEIPAFDAHFRREQQVNPAVL
jgi:hypothetical protein